MYCKSLINLIVKTHDLLTLIKYLLSTYVMFTNFFIITVDSSNRPTIKLHLVTCIKDVSLQLSNVDKQFSQLEFKGYLICKLYSMLKGDISILKYNSEICLHRFMI